MESERGEKWSASGYILPFETTDLINRLDKVERKRGVKITLRILSLATAKVELPSATVRMVGGGSLVGKTCFRSYLQFLTHLELRREA